MNRRQFATALMTAPLSAQSKEEPILVGCIGVGNRGSVHLKNLLKIPNVRVAAICDTDPVHLSIAVDLVVKAGQPKPDTYDDWQKLLARKDIKAVVSALPCDIHARNYLDTLSARKDIYAEKPMAITLEDANTVVKAAGRSDQMFQVGFQRRFEEQIIRSVSDVHAGDIGQLVEGRIHWSISWGPLGGWLGKAARSGDWMVEQAVHNWDVLNWANRSLPAMAMGIGRNDLYRDIPIRSDVLTNRFDKQPDRDVHDYYSAVVEYENGALVNILHSWMAPPQFNDEYTRLFGTLGAVDFNTGLFSYRSDLKKPDRKIETRPDLPHRDLAAMSAFLESVRTRKKPAAGAEQGRESLLACLLVREAVYRRQPVTMKQITG